MKNYNDEYIILFVLYSIIYILLVSGLIDFWFLLGLSVVCLITYFRNKED